MYWLVYGLSLPSPLPPPLPPYPTGIVCLLHTPEKPVLEMYVFLNGYPVLEQIYGFSRQKFCLPAEGIPA